MTHSFSGLKPRRLTSVALERLSEDPVVVLEGPRSVGKSTLLAELARAVGADLLDLDDPATQEAVARDPSTFVNGPRPVFIDEYQKAPIVLDAIKAELQGLGFDAPGMDIQVQGDVVTVSGTAPDAATREKIILAAGNVAGVASVQDAITTADAGPDPQFYTVVHGDTLSGIAQKTMGAASKYPAIFEANKPMLKDPNKIYPGQVLRIPS